MTVTGEEAAISYTETTEYKLRERMKKERPNPDAEEIPRHRLGDTARTALETLEKDCVQHALTITKYRAELRELEQQRRDIVSAEAQSKSSFEQSIYVYSATLNIPYNEARARLLKTVQSGNKRLETFQP